MHDVIHPSLIFYLGFYFDICEWCVLPERAWTPAFMLHLTNPCAKWKVLSLTKPKCEIYKTKSLGHYITYPRHSFFLPLCREAVGVFDSPSRPGNFIFLTVSIEKSQRIIAPFSSLISSTWWYYHFSSFFGCYFSNHIDSILLRR